MDLPKKFLEKIKSFPDGVGEAYLRLFPERPFSGYRVNTLKASADLVTGALGGQAVPFCENGFYLEDGRPGLGNHPLHHAGAFYIQEPSAMSAVTMFSPRPGERVLDLCAAPGGKSTQIGAALRGEGVLLSNEFVASRARVLLSNIERMGVPNAVVTSLHPDTLCEAAAGLFDKVLVDAPCSGEGMFRKEPAAIQNWSEENVRTCALRQGKILDSAARAVRPGGRLCYSTCTFSPEEDEGVVAAFLERHPDFHLIDSGETFGLPGFPAFGGGREDMRLCRRIFPAQGGEGHFAALLQRDGEGEAAGGCLLPSDPPPAVFADFWADCFCDPLPPVRVEGDRVFIPAPLPLPPGIRMLRHGLLVGELAKNRFEPAHALFMCGRYKPRRVLSLHAKEESARRFLHGEQIEAAGLSAGFAGVQIDGVPCGFGKVVDGLLKNRYPKGLRLLRV